MKWDLVTNGRERWHMVQHPRQKKPLKKTDELISNKPNAITYAMDEAGIKKGGDHYILLVHKR